MKKLFLSVFVVVSLVLFVACDGGGGSGDEDSGDSLGVLGVTLNYTGSGTVSATSRIWLDLFTSETAAKSDDVSSPDFYGGIDLDSASSMFTVDTDPGTYYVIVYLDADDGEYVSAGESYELYNNCDTSGTLTPVTITSGETTNITINFDDTHTY